MLLDLETLYIKGGLACLVHKARILLEYARDIA